MGVTGTTIVGVAVLMAAFMLVGPRFGWDTHSILSGSMEPELGVGGTIVTMPVRLTDIKVGDIITFQLGNQLVTHRVAEIVYKDGSSKPWFKTKGDANQQPDASLASSNGEVMAKTVFYVPSVGYLTDFRKNKFVFLSLMAFPSLTLAGLFSKQIWQGVQEERGRRWRRVI